MSNRPTFHPDAVLKLISTNFTPQGISDDIRWFLPHVQVGNGSLYEYFNRPTTQASSHLWVGKDGRLEQYVSFHDRAWAEVAGNRFGISCECEGYPSEPYTTAQIDTLARLLIFMRKEFDIPWTITDTPDIRGIGTHRMGGAAWGGHDCPGDIRANQRGAIIAHAYAIENGADVGIADDQIAQMNNLVPGLNPSDAAHVWAATYTLVNGLLNGSATGSVRWTDANSQLRATAVLNAITEARTASLTVLARIEAKVDALPGVGPLDYQALAHALLQAIAEQSAT